MPAVAQSLRSLRLVTPGNLPHPLLRIAHRPGHFPDRIPQRHPPDHKQVGAQHRIGGLTVQAFQPRGLRFLRISFLAHTRKYTDGFSITPRYTPNLKPHEPRRTRRPER